MLFFPLSFSSCSLLLFRIGNPGRIQAAPGINGDWVKPTTSSNIDSTNDSINVVNPSTGQTITKVSVASKLDIDTAVNTARQALTNWSIDTTLKERRDLVYNLLQLYYKNSEQLAQLISHEMGARKLDV